MAFSPLAETGDSRSLVLIANARLLLLGWMQDNPAYASLYEETFRKLLAMLYNANGAGFALPADENLFLARKVLEIGGRTGLLDRNADLLRGAGLPKLIQAEEQSIRLAEQFPTVDLFGDWQADTLQPLPLGRRRSLRHQPQNGPGDLRRPGLACLRHDPAGRVRRRSPGHQHRLPDSRRRPGVSSPGSEETGREPFAADAVGPCFPGWTIQLFFKDGDVFERAASEQIAIYTWTGVLFIVLILVSGAVAARSIGHQVKLNKLKNDFIATVTHELKTPLASMRVLVDTLLEGNYRDQNQVTEYLQLVSRENERLSRLIDNFLTFSRMERNKQAFQMRPVSPVSIAHAAAEAVKTKLGRGHCCFETDIPDELPEIRADHDAMVTVLVNLLDNAYKYSVRREAHQAERHRRRRFGQLQRQRQRPRHPAPGPEEDLRAVLPGGPQPVPPGRRLRPGPEHRQVHRRRPPGHDHRREQARPGQHVHRHHPHSLICVSKPSERTGEMRRSTALVIVAIAWIGSHAGRRLGNLPLRRGDPQGVAGKWLGIIKTPGMDLRIAFEISEAKEGGYTAVVHSIDQGAMNIPMSTVTLNGDSLRLELKSAFVYEGRLQPDGNTIEGNWIQGDSTPLVMKRVDKIPELNRPQTPKKPYPYSGGGSGIPEPLGECQHCGNADPPQGKGSVSGGPAHRGIGALGP